MNNNNNKKVESGSAPESNNKNTTGSWKRFLGKRWVFPGVYLAAAALILTFMWWIQGNNPSTINTDVGIVITDPSDNGNVAAPTNAQVEDFYAMPYHLEETSVSVAMDFYDDDATVEERSKSMVKYAGAFKVHTGIDYSIDSNETFDVIAAKSGTVLRSESDPLVGNLVEIEHPDGLVSVYQSLSNVLVSVGDEVAQGQIFAEAGQNMYEKDLGVHLHFELRKDNVAVNPNEYLFGSDDSATINNAQETIASEGDGAKAK
ncbi:MAG: M23 family metallopeptidase [Bacilli bacterium]